MAHDTVLLAVEDVLSQAVGERVLAKVGMSASRVIGLRGFGYLKGKAPSLNATAKAYPVLLLTDQDSPERCPPELIRSWIPGELARGLIFRVAVLEVESWVMADSDAFAKHLKIPAHLVPAAPDREPNPKERLVELARRSRSSEVRADLVPSRGSTAAVGKGYNALLCQFVRTHWSPARAAKASPSLRRAVDALRKLRAAAWSP